MARRILLAVGVGGGLLLIGGYALARRRRVGLEALAEDIARAEGADLILLKAMIVPESGWNPNARNCSGSDGAGGCAWGLLQILLDTAKWMGFRGDPKALLDPATNLRIGARLLASYQRRWGGDQDAMRFRVAWRAGQDAGDSWPPDHGSWRDVLVAGEDTFRKALKRYGWTGPVYRGRDIALGRVATALCWPLAVG